MTQDVELTLSDLDSADLCSLDEPVQKKRKLSEKYLHPDDFIPLLQQPSQPLSLALDFLDDLQFIQSEKTLDYSFKILDYFFFLIQEAGERSDSNIIQQVLLRLKNLNVTPSQQHNHLLLLSLLKCRVIHTFSTQLKVFIIAYQWNTLKIHLLWKTAVSLKFFDGMRCMLFEVIIPHLHELSPELINAIVNDMIDNSFEPELCFLVNRFANEDVLMSILDKRCLKKFINIAISMRKFELSFSIIKKTFHHITPVHEVVMHLFRESFPRLRFQHLSFEVFF